MDSEDASPGTRRLLVDLDRTVADQADRHALELESLLAILRSPRLDDRSARSSAIDTAASALVRLRTEADEQRSSILEPVVGAFARLRSDLRPLERFGSLEIQFIEPPATGRALPSEVAHAARAIVRNTILGLVDGGEVNRVRVQWDCDGLNLLVSIRDDGLGTLSVHDESLRPIAERVTSIDGVLSVDATPGWGSSVDVRLPLDPRSDTKPLATGALLTVREHDVLRLVTAGERNQAIAAQLGISANTVKFHVSNLLRKVGASTRAELTALALPR
ncbi:LuxR C-terminal-related transcriptional regulator [Microbacterium sp. AK031]|uniref:helix-turn-helix transcriptional regulator n=1 Tax=Microbacterium sp. AK031 TaxID=2723076 RepID=UPI0021671BDE|nr:LuxR C-terminal-related transcriptional regulator [Microbacterium sp. AK031]MCS3842993.1 DNA-binding CsgD family transcriptional regulator [Microbacterium sp. AK031]